MNCPKPTLNNSNTISSCYLGFQNKYLIFVLFAFDIEIKLKKKIFVIRLSLNLKNLAQITVNFVCLI